MSSELKVTNIKHESSGSNNLVLGSDGTTTVSGALTASGGIANAGTISAGTIGSGVTFPKTISSYTWNNWNPSDISGTYTNASSSGTTTDSDYTSMSNSSGTLTITFDIAGSYLVNLFYRSQHGNSYVYANFDSSAGGSATRIGLIDHIPWGPIPGQGGSISTTNSDRDWET